MKPGDLVRLVRKITPYQAPQAGEIPDLPGMDLAWAQHILIRFSEVREKIQAIVDGEPLRVGGEAPERIMGIIKEEGQ